MLVVLYADTPKLDALTAEKVFGSSEKSGEKEWRVAKSSHHAKTFLKLCRGQCPGRHAFASMYASYGVESGLCQLVVAHPLNPRNSATRSVT